MAPSALPRLVTLAEMLRERELARMSRINQRLADCTRHLAALEVPAPDPQSPALVQEARAYQTYQVWAEARRREIAAEMARLETEKAALRQAAARALGRHSALETVLHRALSPGRG